MSMKRKNMFKKIIEKIYLSFSDNLVYLDSVTGCRTIFYFDKVLRKKFNSKECCVVFIDVNNLKYHNDTFGHYEGTQLIKKITNSLLKLDNIYDICRIGGDEFLMICNMDFNDKQLDSIDNISYGMVFKDKDTNLDSAIIEADKKMYKMKRRIKKK